MRVMMVGKGGRRRYSRNDDPPHKDEEAITKDKKL